MTIDEAVKVAEEWAASDHTSTGGARIIEALRVLLAELEHRKYSGLPHMCRDEHEEIHFGSDEEPCPVCRAEQRAEAAEAALAAAEALVISHEGHIEKLEARLREVEARVQREERERAKRIVWDMLAGLTASHSWLPTGEILSRLDEEE